MIRSIAPIKWQDAAAYLGQRWWTDVSQDLHAEVGNVDRNFIGPQSL